MVVLRVLMLKRSRRQPQRTRRSRIALEASWDQARARAASFSTVFQFRPVPPVLSLSSMSLFVSFERPISAGLLAVSAGLLILSAISLVMKRKDWRAKLAEVEASEGDHGRPS